MMDFLIANWIAVAAVVGLALIGALVMVRRRKPRSESLDDIYPMF